MDDDNVHESHCSFCFRVTDCPVSSKGACVLVYCLCGATLHQCKIEDHKTICSAVKVSCPNSAYGCPFFMFRSNISKHLRHCPASLVYCSYIRNRQFLDEPAKKLCKLRARTKGKDSIPQKYSHDIPEMAIDEHFAHNDQELLECYLSTSRSFRKFLGFPISELDLEKNLLDDEKDENAPKTTMLRDPVDRQMLTMLDSSDEEELTEKRKMLKKKEPFAGCYLCKLSPGSQHLHVLGSLNNKNVPSADQEVLIPLRQQTSLDGTGEHDSEEQQVSMPSEESVDPFVSLPKFYRDRKLFLRTEIAYGGQVYEGLSRIKHRVKALCHPIICGCSVRRDEFPDHYLYHLSMESTPFLVRCPLWPRGCSFVSWRLTSKDGKFRYRYNDFLGMCTVQPTTTTITKIEQQKGRKEGDDGLSVPVQVFDLPSSSSSSSSNRDLFTRNCMQLVQLISPHLDSASLLCLSSVNKQIRRQCFPALKRQMAVDVQWRRVVFNDLPIENDKQNAIMKRRITYIHDGFKWRFTPVQHRTTPTDIALSVQPQSELIEHIQCCEYNDQKQFDPSVQRVKVFPFFNSSSLSTNRPTFIEEEHPYEMVKCLAHRLLFPDTTSADLDLHNE